MRISDWSSDVCSSDLHVNGIHRRTAKAIHRRSAELLRKAGEQRCDPRDILALRGLGISATKQYILDQERVEPATIDDRPQAERRENDRQVGRVSRRERQCKYWWIAGRDGT